MTWQVFEKVCPTVGVTTSRTDWVLQAYLAHLFHSYSFVSEIPQAVGCSGTQTYCTTKKLLLGHDQCQLSQGKWALILRFKFLRFQCHEIKSNRIHFFCLLPLNFIFFFVYELCHIKISLQLHTGISWINILT